MSDPDGINGNFPSCTFQATSGTRWTCTHPRVRLNGAVITPDVCLACHYRELPGNDTAVNRPCGGSHVWTWAVGMTTAPRRLPTLAESLDSVRGAGWEHVRLFAEPDSDVPDDRSGLSITRRDELLGAFPNWLLGLAELYLRTPHADGYVMCQDDVLLADNLREYLEATLWPEANAGVVSVYCPSHYVRNRSPGYHVEECGWTAWGALAYVFPNPSVRILLSDRLVVEHRHHGRAEGMRNIDSVVGSWCERSGRPYWIHVPSLAEHIGQTSTLYRHSSNQGRRWAGDFVADAAQLLALEGARPAGVAKR